MSRTCFVRSTPRSRFKAVLEIRGDARPIELTTGKYNLYSYGGMKFLLGSSSIFLLVSWTERWHLTDFLLLLRRCTWRSAFCHVSVDAIGNISQVRVRLDWIAEDLWCFVCSSSIVLYLLLCLSTNQYGSSDWDHLKHYGGDHKQRLVGLFRQNPSRDESAACCFYPIELNGRRLSAGARHLFCSEQICKSCSSFNYGRVLLWNLPWTSFISGFGDECYWLIE